MSEPFPLWDSAQVAAFVLPFTEEQVTSLFIENNIDGPLLPFLTTDHLRELGIASLGQRLRVKKAINDLIANTTIDKTLTESLRDTFRLNSINIDTNYISIEALDLCLTLLNAGSPADQRRVSQVPSGEEIRALSENFQKLRSEVSPVIRMINNSKPLPTPTLDPGPNHLQNLWALEESDEPGQTPVFLGGIPQLPSATSSTSSTSSSSATDQLPTSNAGTTVSSSIPNSSSKHLVKTAASPTYSKRFSTASILSTGVGKLADFKATSSTRFTQKPRLVDVKLNTLSENDISDSPGPQLLRGKPATSLAAVTTAAPLKADTQPLKQLKASSDDTCLKVLQSAMKRHHIPREKWSKYVLVYCYGDKERILKLTERPVIVFKELQEQGKKPTIMLRELASSENDPDYDDSRIGDDIPGGTL